MGDIQAGLQGLKSGIVVKGRCRKRRTSGEGKRTNRGGVVGKHWADPKGGGARGTTGYSRGGGREGQREDKEGRTKKKKWSAETPG